MIRLKPSVIIKNIFLLNKPSNRSIPPITKNLNVIINTAPKFNSSLNKLNTAPKFNSSLNKLNTVSKFNSSLNKFFNTSTSFINFPYKRLYSTVTDSNTSTVSMNYFSSSKRLFSKVTDFNTTSTTYINNSSSKRLFSKVTDFNTTSTTSLNNSSSQRPYSKVTDPNIANNMETTLAEEEEIKKNSNENDKIKIKLNESNFNSNSTETRLEMNEKALLCHSEIIDNILTDNTLIDNRLTDNGLIDKGLTDNGLTNNSLTVNRLTVNGLTYNGLIDNVLTDSGLTVNVLTVNKSERENALTEVERSELKNNSNNSGSITQRSHSWCRLTDKDIGRRLKVAGWLQFKRMGGQFVIIRDAYDTLQIVTHEQKTIKLMSECRLESIIEAEGLVRRRPNGNINHQMGSGQVELIADRIAIINPCDMDIPFQVNKFQQVKESLRLEHRYLDLRNDFMQFNLRTRSRVLYKMREYLMENQFVDVETPVLFRKTPGGAKEFLVPTHQDLGKAYSLPQSPQQFKQLLMVGGLDRYMQIAKCFRDESAKPDRQPEFTQLDIEMSFVRRQDIKEIIEGLLVHSMPDNNLLAGTMTDEGRYIKNTSENSSSNGYRQNPPVNGREELFPSGGNYSEHDHRKGVGNGRGHCVGRGMIKIPFPSMDYEQAINCYGTDKPDTRYDMRLNNVTELFERCDFGPLNDVFKKVGSTTITSMYDKMSIQAVRVPFVFDNLSKKDYTELQSVIRSTIPSHLSVFFAITRVKYDKIWSGNLQKYIELKFVKRLEEKLQLLPGDTFILTAGPHLHACQVAGKFRTVMASLLEERGVSVYDKENAMNFLWVENFPLFLPKDDGSSVLESAHHPFTAPIPEHAELLYTQPQNVIGQHYDLVLNGSEIGGGSIRIHNAEVQRYVLADILKEDTGPMKHLLDALKSGCPPHGGIALGIDRYLSMLCQTSSIRDVIAFPKSSEGRCLMSKAPAVVSAEDQKYYHIKFEDAGKVEDENKIDGKGCNS